MRACSLLVVASSFLSLVGSAVVLLLSGRSLPDRDPMRPVSIYRDGTTSD
jgi:hypothetical protein